MNETIIELENVSVSFDGDEGDILKNINLKIKRYDTFIVIGPSGSGKTVLLKTMAGLYTPRIGRVLCEGHELSTLNSQERQTLAQHLGMQFQRSALFDSLSVFDNVAFPLREQGHFSEEDVTVRVQECLEAVNLAQAGHLLPHEISGGMRQRLGIARAIAMKPDILFYDDPTAGLDPVHTDKIVDLILDLKKAHPSTIIAVTHSMDVAYRLNGTIGMIIDGELIITGDAERTQNHPDPRVQRFIHGRLT